MTLEVKPAWAAVTETVELDAPAADRKYFVSGAADESQVKAAAALNIPLYYGKLKRLTITVGERLGQDTWEVTAHYELPTWAPTSFDVSTTTKHITQSLETLLRVGPDAKDLGRQVNVDKDGVKGVDVFQAVSTFQVTKTLDVASSVAPYLRLVAAAVGSVNSRPFQGFRAGEVLLAGVTGQRKNAGQYTVNFKFAVQLTKQPEEVGPKTGWLETPDPNNTQEHPLPPIHTPLTPIQVPERPGWSYIWFSYSDVTVFPDPGGSHGGQDIKKGVQQHIPMGVYVEQIYPESNFDLLGVPSI